MKQRFRTGGIAAWSIRRPIGVIMLTLAVVVPGLIALKQLGVDLLPKIIYPEINVRIFDTGVPARIMEDQVTRQLEEQLGITEDAIAIQSQSRNGRSSVDLTFAYGTDIDKALRDASTRLDRAKRFLPDTVDPPIIFKRDPSQLPVMQLAVSSTQRNTIDLRNWVDYRFSKWFINLPGVAAAEIGGGLQREIEVAVDQERMAAAGLNFAQLADRISEENLDASGGRLLTSRSEISARVEGRVTDPAELALMTLGMDAGTGDTAQGAGLRLGDIAEIRDTHADEILRIRLNTVPGVKVSMQKQPQANTVAVADAIKQRLDWLRAQNLLPPDIDVHIIDDQSVFVRQSVRNAAMAAISGALLAMIVVFIFLGNLRRTLIVGTAIPLAILVTFILMQVGGLTLNIMTLGGLALGVGILVDNTIVMLENIYRHQRQKEADGLNDQQEAVVAASEVNSAIVASTSTNLAAILPFLFIGGLYGLLFRELIFTISAGMIASLIVALTLVPSLSARVTTTSTGITRRFTDRLVLNLQNGYVGFIKYFTRHPLLTILIFIPAFTLAIIFAVNAERTDLPRLDNGTVRIIVRGDPGMQLEEMDSTVRKLESLFLAQADVANVYTQAGGFVFGRTERQSSDRSTMTIELKPMATRGISSEDWINRTQKQIDKLGLSGFRIIMRVQNVRGLRTSRGDDDISIRVQGPDLDTLAAIGDEIIERIRDLKLIRNAEHTYEGRRDEMLVRIDRERAADLRVNVIDISRALRVALDGIVVSDYLEGDREYDVRLRLPQDSITSPEDLGNVIVDVRQGAAIRLRDVTRISFAQEPNSILRDRQLRAMEVSASLSGNATLSKVMEEIETRLRDLELPAGYTLYDAGASETLKKGQSLIMYMLALAVFMVFVVMAVQYESLRNPLVIMFSILFTPIGVAAGLFLLEMPISMPVGLGMIMLAGIVVNNAIVYVEQIGIEREHGHNVIDAITLAGRARLRPILMTALTTVMGMLPLAIGLGEGSEMLQPLAVVIVWGLSFSTLVSLVLVPSFYRLFHHVTVTA